MNHFPISVNLSGKTVYLIGDGPQIRQKAEKMKPFEAVLTHKQTFTEADARTAPAMVIVGDTDVAKAEEIASLCGQYRIPVNVVDDQEYCDFVFPSYIAQGNLSIGICTNGASPAAGVLLKRKILEQVPDNMEEILNFLHEKRPVIAKTLTDKKQRYKFYYELSEICMRKNRPLTEDEFRRQLQWHVQSAKKNLQESKD